jgi:HPt (histidine-containing phosphotransfer) domain-containing protein
MASNTGAARQTSLPPIVDECHASSKVARQASVEPKIAAEAARARSVSVEPDSEVVTPKATSPAPQSSGETREQSVEPLSSLPPSLGTVDMEIFQQILELDEDGTRDFSRGMTWAYFSQVGTTFTAMDKALDAKDLKKLSDLGHFLKGSSAALGVSKVQASCEKIQHYGALWDEEAKVDLIEEDALGMIRLLLGTVKEEYDAAEQWMKRWYSVNDPDGE